MSQQSHSLCLHRKRRGFKSFKILRDSCEFIVNIQTPQGLRFLSYLCFSNLHLYAVLLHSTLLFIDSQATRLGMKNS